MAKDLKKPAKKGRGRRDLEGLTQLERELLGEFLTNGGDATKAYLTVGRGRPSPATAAVEACRILQRPAVRARLDAVTAKASTGLEITAERILGELAKIGFANMADYFRIGSDGDPVLDFSNLTRDQAAAIAEVTVEDFKDGRGDDARDVRRIKFKLHDKRAALVDLGKHLRLFSERVEVTGRLTLEQLVAASQGLKPAANDQTAQTSAPALSATPTGNNSSKGDSE